MHGGMGSQGGERAAKTHRSVSSPSGSCPGRPRGLRPARTDDERTAARHIWKLVSILTLRNDLVAGLAQRDGQNGPPPTWIICLERCVVPGAPHARSSGPELATPGEHHSKGSPGSPLGLIVAIIYNIFIKNKPKMRKENRCRQLEDIKLPRRRSRSGKRRRCRTRRGMLVRKLPIVCPPFTHLAMVAGALKGSDVELGAQKLAPPRPKGAYTGEVAAQMIAALGCKCVILGHSRRRQYYGETWRQPTGRWPRPMPTT